MDILKKLFGKQNNNSKEQFFSGWEVSLDGKEDCENFLLTQCVDKETAKSSSSYIHLVFGEDKFLKSGRLFSDGKEEAEGHLLENLKLDEAIGTLIYQDIIPNKVYNFHEDNKGLHQIGGNFPTDFQVPISNLKVPFQYLGYFENTDEAFSWLPFKLNLICPIFLNIGKVFLDYSDPLKPVLLDKEQAEKADCSYDELNQDTKIIFNPVKFRTTLSTEVEYGLGHTGVPNWIQYPDIPRCPKTNKTMKFVCQLRSDVGVEVRESNVIPSSDFMASYFKQMNFWGDGDLFVFFEPSSKTACYLIQNT